MKLVVAVGLTALIAAVLVQWTGSAVSNCGAGKTLGFVAIRQDPPYLVGTIPSRFTRQARYFQRRYNCLGFSAEVRRVDEGIYDVRFIHLTPRAAVATALSDEAVSASAFPLGNDTVRVALRGPLGNGVAARRDVPFTVVIY